MAKQNFLTCHAVFSKQYQRQRVLIRVFLALLIFSAQPILGQVHQPDANKSQQEDLAHLIEKTTLPMVLKNGHLSGAGLDSLLARAEGTQFFAIGEQHNRKQIPEFTVALFEALQEHAGFEYLILEQGPEAMHLVSREENRGNEVKIAGLAQKYQRAFTFVSDQELAMLAAVGRLSRAENRPIWGCERSRGALHILDSLLAIASDNLTQREVSSLREEAHEVEQDRHRGFFLGDPKITSRLTRLRKDAAPTTSERFRSLLDELIISSKTIEYFRNGQRGKLPGFYSNNAVRENHMRDLCLKYYKEASSEGEPVRALLKFGHMHLYRGLTPTNVPSLGNQMAELANSNGMHLLSIYALGQPSLMDIKNDPEWVILHPFLSVLKENEWALIDLKEFREYPTRNMLINAPSLTGDGREKEMARRDLEKIIYSFDYLLIIPGLTKASFTIADTQY